MRERDGHVTTPGLLTRWKDNNGELVFDRTETIDGGAVEKPGVRAVDVTYNEHAVL